MQCLWPVARGLLPTLSLLLLAVAPLGARAGGGVPVVHLQDLLYPDPASATRLRLAALQAGAVAVVGCPTAGLVAHAEGLLQSRPTPEAEVAHSGALLEATHPWGPSTTATAPAPQTANLSAAVRQAAAAYLRLLDAEGVAVDWAKAGHESVHALRRLGGGGAAEAPELAEWCPSAAALTVVSMPAALRTTPGEGGPGPAAAPAWHLRRSDGAVIRPSLPPDSLLLLHGVGLVPGPSTPPAFGVAGPDTEGLTQVWYRCAFPPPADPADAAGAAAPSGHSRWRIQEEPADSMDDPSMAAMTSTSFCNTDLPGLVMWMTGFQTVGVSGDPCLALLFPEWELKTAGAFAGACFGVFVTAVVTEGLGACRRRLRLSFLRPQSRAWRTSLLGAGLLVLFGTQTTLSLFLMLIVMSYQVELLLMVLFGLMTGYGAFHVDWRLPPRAPLCECSVALCRAREDAEESCDCPPGACAGLPSPELPVRTPCCTPYVREADGTAPSYV